MSLTTDWPVVKTGDFDRQFQGIQIRGVRPDNSDRGRFYLVAAPNGSDVDVTAYRDREHTLVVATLVAGTVGERVGMTSAIGLDISLYVCSSVASSGTTVWTQLCSDHKLKAREQDVFAVGGDATAGENFSIIHEEVMTDFLIAFAAIHPVPSRSFLSDTMPGAGKLVPAGTQGELPDDAYAFWELDVNNDYALVGMQNPGDLANWAVARAREIMWERKAVDDDDPSGRRAAFLAQKATKAWKMVLPLLDDNRDGIPAHAIKTTSYDITRG